MTNWNIYILVVSTIGVYYFIKVTCIICRDSMFECLQGIRFFMSIKKRKNIFFEENIQFGTPTETTVKCIVFIFKELKTIINVCFENLLLSALIGGILFVAYWFFTADHANSSWIWYVQKFWWTWYLVRGTIFFLFVGAAWKQLKTFPKIIYFKDLRFVISRSFLLIYLVVLIFTIVEVIKAIAFGEINTPLYMYYVDWYQQIIG